MDREHLKKAILREAKQCGWTNLLNDILLRSVNRVVYLKVSRGVVYHFQDWRSGGNQGTYSARTVGLELILPFCRYEEFGLPEDFVRRSIKRGDRCCAIFKGDLLVGHSWYTNSPTPIDNGLLIRFDPQYLYAFHSFIHRAHRGRRAMAAILDAVLHSEFARQYKGVVAYIEENNIRSRHASRNLGFTEFGKIYLLRLFGRFLVLNTPSCKEYGFAVVRAPAEPEKAGPLEAAPVTLRRAS